jgi:hypothetical protein
MPLLTVPAPFSVELVRKFAVVEVMLPLLSTVTEEPTPKVEVAAEIIPSTITVFEAAKVAVVELMVPVFATVTGAPNCVEKVLVLTVPLIVSNPSPLFARVPVPVTLPERVCEAD